jgi:hypothetical protein
MIPYFSIRCGLVSMKLPRLIEKLLLADSYNLYNLYNLCNLRARETNHPHDRRDRGKG